MVGMVVHCNHCGRLQDYTGDTVVEIVEQMSDDEWLLCDVGRYYASGYCAECQEQRTSIEDSAQDCM